MHQSCVVHMKNTIPMRRRTLFDAYLIDSSQPLTMTFAYLHCFKKVKRTMKVDLPEPEGPVDADNITFRGIVL